MRDLFLLAVFVIYLGLGLTAPFVATLGYLWVDLAAPQAMGYSYLRTISLSMIMGLMAVVLYAAFERKENLKPSSAQVLLLIFALWVTLTTTWALVPDEAWWKWNWAIKTIIFACFAPYVINNRVRFEAFAATFIISIGVNFLPVGAKTILSGGGYGSNLTILGGNSKIAESSSLAMASVMSLPLIYALYKHNSIFAQTAVFKITVAGFAVLAIFATFGTYARTGLVCVAALVGLQLLHTKRKLVILPLLAVVGIGILGSITGNWADRMETMRNPLENTSASVRLGVWKWTTEFAKENPMGGGFEVFRINIITLERPSRDQASLEPEIVQQRGRAFHSMYFEVLGEHGYPGLAIFLLIFFTLMKRLYQIYKSTTDDPELEWINRYTLYLMQTIVVLLVGGLFVGIAFQPVTLFSISMAIMLINIHQVQAGSSEGTHAKIGSHPSVQIKQHIEG